MKQTVLLVLVLLTFGCSAPKPPALPEADLKLPTLAESRIVLPVRKPLGDLAKAMDRQVPLSETRMGAWVQLSRGEYPKVIKYKWSRTPFAIRDHPNRVCLTTTVTYEYKMAQREAQMPPGQGYWWREEFMPRGSGTADLTVLLEPRLNQEWKLSVESKVEGLPSDLRRFIGLGDLNSVAQSRLGEHLRALPDTWKMLTTPAQFDSQANAWLLLNPNEFAYSALHSDGDDVETRVEIVAQPSVVLGSIADHEPRPLPDPLQRDVGDGLLSVYLDAGVTYDEVNATLKGLVGRKYGSGLSTAEIKSIHIDGRGDVCRVSIELSGFPFSGTIYLLGGVKYDTLSRRMWVPAIAEDAEKGLQFHAAGSIPGWVVRSALKDDVNAMLSWNVAPLIDEQLGQLSSSFGHATEQRLRLGEPQIEPRSVFATDDALRVYLEVTARVIENR